MSNPNLENNESIRSRYFRKAPLALLGAVIIGMIGSGMWDLLAKPSLTYFGRIFLNTITLGSKTINDSAYSLAALDPTPLPSLIMFYLLTFIPGLWAISPAFDLFASPLLDKKMEKFKNKIEEESAPDRAKETLTNKYMGTLKRVRLLILVLLFFMFIMSVTLSKIVNQSVLIWRIFNANAQIVAPYTSDAELKIIKADFASIKTKKDFTLIESKLKNIADEHKIVLRSEALW